MSSKRRGFVARVRGGVGPSSWSTSVAVAGNAWRKPKKPRTARAKQAKGRF